MFLTLSDVKGRLILINSDAISAITPRHDEREGSLIYTVDDEPFGVKEDINFICKALGLKTVEASTSPSEA